MKFDIMDVSVIEISSRPARALWIEIMLTVGQQQPTVVEAREGLVD